MKMGEERKDGWAVIAQELAYAILRRRRSAPENSRENRRVLGKELSAD